MAQFRSITIATAFLLGLAGAAFATGIGMDRASVQANGRYAIVMAEYRLACELGR